MIITDMVEKTQKKILFITSSIPESESDWKSVFIGDMLKAFSKKQEMMLYWGPSGIIPDNTVNLTRDKHLFWLDKMVRKGGIANIIRGDSFSDKIVYTVMLLFSIRNSAKFNCADFDTYFVNWLQNSILLPSDGKDLVITVLGSDMGLLNSWYMKYLLLRVFSKRKTIILPNAKWMVEPLESAFGTVADIKLHELGIRDEWFSSVEREPSIWLSVSRITEKKVRVLLDWGKSVFNLGEKLTLIGPSQESLVIPDWVDRRGSATLKELKNLWYPKARALIFLSEHDEGRPQTIIEAMASGVPVICLDKPLYREFIHSGFNGYLVGCRDELKLAIKKLSDESHNLIISKNAQQSIEKKTGGWSQYVDEVVKVIEA